MISKRMCERCRQDSNGSAGSRATMPSNLVTRWRHTVWSGKKFRAAARLDFASAPRNRRLRRDFAGTPDRNIAEGPMTSYRTDQVGEQVREEIMSIIRRELKDPRIGFVSITAVRMSPDLRSARVRVRVLGDPDQKKASIKGLDSARALIRHELR